ncbi:hypothetical protein V8E36_004698 [Tilletia maclaganii]
MVSDVAVTWRLDGRIVRPSPEPDGLGRSECDQQLRCICTRRGAWCIATDLRYPEQVERWMVEGQQQGTGVAVAFRMAARGAGRDINRRQLVVLDSEGASELTWVAIEPHRSPLRGLRELDEDANQEATVARDDGFSDFRQVGDDRLEEEGEIFSPVARTMTLSTRPAIMYSVLVIEITAEDGATTWLATIVSAINSICGGVAKD